MALQWVFSWCFPGWLRLKDGIIATLQAIWSNLGAFWRLKETGSPPK
jgi:hypothetical protein